VNTINFRNVRVICFEIVNQRSLKNVKLIIASKVTLFWDMIVWICSYVLAFIHNQRGVNLKLIQYLV